MDTLQIQDSFQPYYAERPKRPEVGRSVPMVKGGEIERPSEIATRLERCRARLAKAIAAEAERH